MSRLRERINTGALIIVPQVVVATTIILAGAISVPLAAIIASPAIVPALNYRGYTGIARFDYERYRTEKSYFGRFGEAVTVSVLAGLPAVPLGLAVFFLAPLSRQPRFIISYLVSIVIAFIVGSLVAFWLNREYLQDGWG